ncbi:pseudouridine synthase [Mycoplasma procyoni]|uniref:pseudouridine synthase n=1 Tax=Mycoplasma procyoni TaxID=568784 RepID=UPI00197B4924|nr:pseudouridine synthase [Mycoplasma procyoni]MBN3534395.1 rRNA pseudouridine synthase [Mycoplasma procyoni]
MKKERIEKVIASKTQFSRSQAKDLIKQKRVKLNGNIISSLVVVDQQQDEIAIDDKILYKGKNVYFLMNKPQGYVCANKDNLHETVFELLNPEDRNISDLHTVGRLDLDTEGLLLITNDGELSHDLLSPSKHVKKTYYVEVDKELKPELIDAFAKGIDIKEDKLTKPAKLEIITEKTCNLVISEGKFHQVKRMFSAFHYTVLFLKRIKFHNLELPNDLQKGQYIRISKEEILN